MQQCGVGIHSNHGQGHGDKSTSLFSGDGRISCRAGRGHGTSESTVTWQWQSSHTSPCAGRARETMAEALIPKQQLDHGAKTAGQCQQLWQEHMASAVSSGRECGRKRRGPRPPRARAKKRNVFHLHAVLKETLSLPKAPQLVRYTDVHGRNTPLAV